MMQQALINEFIAESCEGLDRMERGLTDLETDPQDAALLADIFRTVHTIKGTTGFLGFNRMEKLAHAGESLLGAMRDGRVAAGEAVVGTLLELMDRFRSILALIEKTQQEGESDEDDRSLMARLLGLVPERAAAAPPRTTPASARKPVVSAAPAAGLAAGGLTHKPSEPVAAAATPAEKATVRVEAAEQSLRIDVEVLNRMMNLVGELVLTRNQLLQSSLAAENFPKLARRLDAVTADLRETVMQARMQPVGQLFGKLPRMVRDLAKMCGKQVRIEFAGQGTGLDKSLLEAIKDPLAHALRNAIDHGIEPPAQRLAAGKPAEGAIRLRAFHQSGSMVIELCDDGAGIAVDLVLAKALERGMVSEQRAAEMTEREALQLVFAPGFSTAAKVTNISGRGVGMDVVRLNVESVGGSVDLESKPNVGTTLRMRVPLTLAIVPALIVRSGNQSFCLPQSALAELVYIPSRELNQAFERIGEAELYRLRETLLPIVWLERLLQSEDATGDGAAAKHGTYLAVLEAESCRYGLVVDDLLAPEEIVVKPLSAVLRAIGLFSGATVLGNGTLALILDVPAVAERAGVRPAAAQPAAQPAAAAGTAVAAEAEGGSFLIFQGASAAGRSERVALPLDAVERIESVPLGQVEYAEGRPILQYRGELLPLEDNDGVLAELAPLGSGAIATILICRRTGTVAGDQNLGRRIGMVVREVLDVSNGLLMEPDGAVCESNLAMVKERLTIVHADFLPAGRARWSVAA